MHLALFLFLLAPRCTLRCLFGRLRSNDGEEDHVWRTRRSFMFLRFTSLTCRKDPDDSVVIWYGDCWHVSNWDAITLWWQHPWLSSCPTTYILIHDACLCVRRGHIDVFEAAFRSNWRKLLQSARFHRCSAWWTYRATGILNLLESKTLNFQIHFLSSQLYPVFSCIVHETLETLVLGLSPKSVSCS